MSIKNLKLNSERYFNMFATVGDSNHDLLESHSLPYKTLNILVEPMQNRLAIHSST